VDISVKANWIPNTSTQLYSVNCQNKWRLTLKSTDSNYIDSDHILLPMLHNTSFCSCVSYCVHLLYFWFTTRTWQLPAWKNNWLTDYAPSWLIEILIHLLEIDPDSCWWRIVQVDCFLLQFSGRKWLGCEYVHTRETGLQGFDQSELERRKEERTIQKCGNLLRRHHHNINICINTKSLWKPRIRDSMDDKLAYCPIMRPIVCTSCSPSGHLKVDGMAISLFYSVVTIIKLIYATYSTIF
jgi:hypothetical protein